MGITLAGRRTRGTGGDGGAAIGDAVAGAIGGVEADADVGCTSAKPEGPAPG